ncbi:unnamed protein product [Lota lota]
MTSGLAQLGPPRGGRDTTGETTNLDPGPWPTTCPLCGVEHLALANGNALNPGMKPLVNGHPFQRAPANGEQRRETNPSVWRPAAMMSATDGQPAQPSPWRRIKKSMEQKHRRGKNWTQSPHQRGSFLQVKRG